MIRKTFAFLFLVAAGLIALWLVTGKEGFRGDLAGERATPRKAAADSGGVQIRGPEEGSDFPQGLSVKVGGKMSIPRTRTVQIGNRTRELQVYLLRCEDSVPIGDDRLHMFDLAVDFFEPGGPAGDPRSVLAARLTADEAFAQLGVDDKGRTSIEEDKEMRVIGAVIETTDRARVPNLRMEVDEALALATDAGIRVYTPDSTQPFRLHAMGEEPWEITGRGLVAWLPRQGGRPGDQVKIEVLNRPQLIQITADGLTRLSSRGGLSYQENPADGRTLILMQDRVQISMAGGGMGEPLEARGQRLRARLTRHRTTAASGPRGAGDRASQWQRIWLEGDPVELTGSGAELTCSELAILPGPGNEPYLFSATGSPAVMTYRNEAGIPTRIEASRRIHVLRPGNHQAPLFTAFGFPSWSLGPLNRHELIILEGHAVVDQGEGLWHLKASDGLWLMRSLPPQSWLSAILEQPDDAESGAPLAMHGRGIVEVDSGEYDLSLEGNMGFTMLRSGDVQHIRLGPASLEPEHRYRVTRGTLVLEGVGTCLMTRSRTTERISVVLRAAGPRITASFGPGRGSLLDADGLDVSLAGGALSTFAATGPVCRIEWGPDNRLVATAQKIEGLDPHSFRLSGTVTSPARADYRPEERLRDDRGVRARNVRVWGTRIGIHRLTGDRFVIRTEAPDPGARVQLEAVRGEEPPTTIDLHARRIRYLPFAVDPAAINLRALPPGARQLFAPGPRSPYLLAEQKVSIVQVQERVTQRASGDFLMLGLGSRGGYLTGDPARLQRQDAQDQTVTGIASRVELRSESEGELLGLVATPDRPPELDIIDPTGSLSQKRGEPARMHVRCDDDIHVLPEAIRFLGTVEMRSVKLDGGADPEGLRMLADSVTMVRDAQTGEILEVRAEGNVRLHWSKIVARGHLLTLDPEATLITVSDPERQAVVELPSGPLRRYTGGMVRANYRTYRVTAWFSRIDGGGTGR